MTPSLRGAPAEDLGKLPGFGAAFPVLSSFEVERELRSPQVSSVIG
jgi:hypothetical protein